MIIIHGTMVHIVIVGKWFFRPVRPLNINSGVSFLVEKTLLIIISDFQTSNCGNWENEEAYYQVHNCYKSSFTKQITQCAI